MKPGQLRHRVIFEKMDENTEEWDTYYSCSAKVNPSGGNEYLAGGAERSSSDVVFTVRYCNALKNIYLDTQSYRILFENGVFDVKVVDDYMFLHTYLNIKATGKVARQ